MAKRVGLTAADPWNDRSRWIPQSAIRNPQSAIKHPLLQRRLGRILGPGHKLVHHDHAGAGIPTQERVVIAGWPQRFRVFVAGHGFAQECVSFKAGAGTALMELSLGPSL